MTLKVKVLFLGKAGSPSYIISKIIKKTMLCKLGHAEKKQTNIMEARPFKAFKYF